jgi:hypothetical protein
LFTIGGGFTIGGFLNPGPPGLLDKFDDFLTGGAGGGFLATAID